MDGSFCGPTVVAAIGFVAHTDAVIFDLPQNGGGQPAMVTLIASYLFDRPTHLIDIYNRKEDSTAQNWTLSPYGQNTRATRQARVSSMMNSSVMRDRFHWARHLPFVTGLVNQELLLRNEYLAAENRILRGHLPSRLRLSDAERSTLAEIAKRLGRKALQDIARVAKPDTILAWYRRLVAQKFDGSRQRAYPGRPRVFPELEALVIRFARENRSWGYDRIAGALANLGHRISDQTVGNILRRHNIAPAPERSRTTTWREFIGSHTDVLAGADFFTVEVLSWRGLVTYYVLFFIEIGTRRVSLGGITRHPDSGWMEQVARHATMENTGHLNRCRYLLHDRGSRLMHMD